LLGPTPCPCLHLRHRGPTHFRARVCETVMAAGSRLGARQRGVVWVVMGERPGGNLASSRSVGETAGPFTRVGVVGAGGLLGLEYREYLVTKK
jgi:hypothetical protein